MPDATILLIKPGTRERDADGVWRTNGEQRREIFARVDSVGRSEFFAGGQTGMRPELRITINAIEYEGEETCELDGVRYAIYRTYRVADNAFWRTEHNSANADDLELYVQREVGVHGTQNTAG